MVELVVILLVVGVLAAILIPAIGTWLEEYRLNIAGQQVADALQAAKMAAVAKSRRTELVFDVPGNRLGRDGAPLADLPPGVRFSPAGVSSSPDPGVPTTAEPVTFPPLSGDTGLRAAAFTARGLPDVDPGRSNAVFLTNSRGTCAVVMTSAGNVRILEWSGSKWE
jgi:type II secretory pathway pseudopilin PulG